MKVYIVTKIGHHRFSVEKIVKLFLVRKEAMEFVNQKNSSSYVNDTYYCKGMVAK